MASVFYQKRSRHEQTHHDSAGARNACIKLPMQSRAIKDEINKSEMDARILLKLLTEMLHLQAGDTIYPSDFARMWVTSAGEAIELDAAMERCLSNSWLSAAPGGYRITPAGIHAAT